MISNPLSFGEIISPNEEKVFFNEYLGKKFLYSKGDKHRFGYLLPWNELNKLLSEHRLDEPRLRLAKNGVTLSAKEYTNYLLSRRGVNIPRLLPNKLNEKLIEGATLIIDAVDEIYEPIKQLSLHLERLFNTDIQVNAYVGFGNSTGFDTHWDDHDVFILQLSGKKKWFIYGETRKFPLYRDTVIDTNAPTKPIWKKTITEGDLLYIPRGWWHNAIPCNEPSLHLTIGLTNKTGIDLFNFLSEKLLDDDFFRKDIPHLLEEKELRNYLKDFKSKIGKIFKEDTFKDYLKKQNENVLVRQRFSLPQSIYKQSDLSDESEIRLAISRNIAIDINVDDEIIYFVANGNRWKFSITVKPFFDLLFKDRKCSVLEAKKSCPSITTETFDLFVKELLATGIVYLKYV